MRKNKALNILATIMLIFSTGVVIYRLIESIVYNVNGWYLAIPGPALYKWYEIFCFNMLGDIIFVGPIFLLGIILLVFAKKNNYKVH